MDVTLSQQLSQAQAALKAQADDQNKMAKASGKITAEIRRITDLKRAAVDAAEAAAQVGARRLLGEATAAEAEDAKEAATNARFAAAGADEAIAQLNREAELVSQRYHATISGVTAAQNVCNQIQAAMIVESANASAAEYLATAQAMAAALLKLVAHAKALERIQGATTFAAWVPSTVEVPAFPGLDAFKGSPHHKLSLPVANDAQHLSAAVSAVLGSVNK